MANWKNVATVASAALLTAAVAGVGIASIIPKSIEFSDVKVIDASAEHQVAFLFTRSSYDMEIEFPNGNVATIPTNVDVTGKIGETIRVKVVENLLGGYNVFISE